MPLQMLKRLRIQKNFSRFAGFEATAPQENRVLV